MGSLRLLSWTRRSLNRSWTSLSTFSINESCFKPLVVLIYVDLLFEQNGSGVSLSSFQETEALSKRPLVVMIIFYKDQNGVLISLSPFQSTEATSAFSFGDDVFLDENSSGISVSASQSMDTSNTFSELVAIVYLCCELLYVPWSDSPRIWSRQLCYINPFL